MSKFKTILDYLDKNYNNPNLTIQKVSEDLKISRVTIHRIIKKSTDLSTTAFFNDFRIQKSNQLLKQGGLKIKEVAFLVGYTDPNYFSKLYKAKYGTSPSEWNKY